MTATRGAAAALAFALLLGCDDEPSQDEVAGETAGQAETTVEDVQGDIPPPSEPAPDEACARVLVVAWEGAEYASEDITRTRDEARARAEELRGQLEEGADFEELAREESDAASTAPRGGLMGTYQMAEWPEPYEPIKTTVYGLAVHQLSEVVEAPFGWVVAKRCPVEKVHTRHILIRHEGAEGAPEDLERTEEEARELAAEIREEVTAEDADFEAIARERSEDTSAERGGDMGFVGRGRFAELYEEAAFALDPGEISDPVHTEFGYHLIQRLE